MSTVVKDRVTHTKRYQALSSPGEKGNYTAQQVERQALSDFEICYSDKSGALLREAVEYSYIMRKRYRTEKDEEIQLFCTDGRIVIYGRSLKIVWERLRHRTLDSIEVFDPKRHQVPGEDEVMIREVQILPFGASSPANSDNPE